MSSRLKQSGCVGKMNAVREAGPSDNRKVSKRLFADRVLRKKHERGKYLDGLKVDGRFRKSAFVWLKDEVTESYYVISSSASPTITDS